MPFDEQALFQKQIEECRALERQALSTNERAFWQHAAERWEKQLRRTQAQTLKRPQQCVQTSGILSQNRTNGDQLAPAVKREAEEDWGC